MKTLKMALTAIVLAGGAVMSGAALADDAKAQGWGGERPSYCYDRNDWRSRDPNYCPAGDGRYDDRRYDDRRGDDRRYDDRRYGDRRYDDRRYDDRRYDDRRYGDGRYGDRGYGRGERIIQRQDFPTPYRARIVLVERLVWTRHGEQCICTVTARGPDAEYVSYRQLRRVARNYCSPRSHIDIGRY